MPKLVLLVKHPSESDYDNQWSEDKVTVLNTNPEIKSLIDKYSLQGVQLYIQRQDSKKVGCSKRVIQAVDINPHRILKRPDGTYDVPLQHLSSLDEAPYGKSTRKGYYWA